MDASVLQALGPTYDLLKKLLEADITIQRSVIVWYHDNVIQYSINIMLGNNESKRQKFAQMVQSYFKEPIVFSSTLDYTCTFLPAGLEVEKSGIVSIKNETFKLDLSALVRHGGFDVFLIQIKCKLPKGLLRNLIIPNSPKNGKREGSYVVSHFTISLDEVPSWLEVYERFEVRDIEFTHTIGEISRVLSSLIPQEFSKKIMAAARAHNSGNIRAADFFSIMSKHFLEFESDLYSKRLLSGVSVDEEDFEVTRIQTKMEQYALTDSGLGPVIPKLFIVTIKGGITAEEIVKKGHVRIELATLNEILGELVQRTEMETRALRL